MRQAQELREQKKEALRAEEVADHSHGLDCQKTGKITKEYDTSSMGVDSPMFGSMSYYVHRIASTCSECGQEEILHGNYRRHEFRNILSAGQLPPTVVTGIVECIRGAFGEAPSDTAEHISGDRITVIPHRHDGEARRDLMAPPYLGFSSLVFGSPAEVFGRPDLTQEKGVYLAATAVVKEMQGTFVGQRLNNFHLNTLVNQRLPVFFTRTQNPRVEGGILRSLEQAKKDGKIASYRIERHLVPGHYGQRLTTEPQRTSVAQTQESYDRIQSDQGDAYLLLFHVEYPVVQKRSR